LDSYQDVLPLTVESEHLGNWSTWFVVVFSPTFHDILDGLAECAVESGNVTKMATCMYIWVVCGLQKGQESSLIYPKIEVEKSFHAILYFPRITSNIIYDFADTCIGCYSYILRNKW